MRPLEELSGSEAAIASAITAKETRADGIPNFKVFIYLVF